jgi:hypothetical protein
LLILNFQFSNQPACTMIRFQSVPARGSFGIAVAW